MKKFIVLGLAVSFLMVGSVLAAPKPGRGPARSPKPSVTVLPGNNGITVKARQTACKEALKNAK